MKILILISLLGLCFCYSEGAHAQEIKWMTMNHALAAQKKEPKKIIMDAYTTWCAPCKKMDRTTFSNKAVVDYINENYYAVKFNAEGTERIKYKEHIYENRDYDPKREGRNNQHPFASAVKISVYPTLVFFDEEGNLLSPMIQGYNTAEELEIFLKMFAQDDYKKITSNETWQEYKTKFKGEFNNLKPSD